MHLTPAHAAPQGAGVSTFVARTPYQASHPTALAIYCSDGRFTEAVEELLHHLGHKRLDTLTLPGGPGLLNPWACSVLEAQQVLKSAEMLIKNHAIRDVVLLAHAGCGHYRLTFPTLSPEEMKARQIADLGVAARALTAAGVKVHRYWLEPEGERVRFDLLPDVG